MKKIFIFAVSLTVLLSLAYAGSPVKAANVFQSCATTKLSQTNLCKSIKTSNSSTNPVVTVIGSIIKILEFIAGILAVIMATVSAYRFTTSQGDPNNVKQARQTLTFAIIGIVVVLISQTILSFVIGHA